MPLGCLWGGNADQSTRADRGETFIDANTDAIHALPPFLGQLYADQSTCVLRAHVLQSEAHLFPAEGVLRCTDSAARGAFVELVVAAIKGRCASRPCWGACASARRSLATAAPHHKTVRVCPLSLILDGGGVVWNTRFGRPVVSSRGWNLLMRSEEQMSSWAREFVPGISGVERLRILVASESPSEGTRVVRSLLCDDFTTKGME